MNVMLLGPLLALVVTTTRAEVEADATPPGIYVIHPTLNAEGRAVVPGGLDEAILELRRMISPELLELMRVDEEDGMNRFHHGLGTWLRNNWGLWHGSELARRFHEMGIFHADDMSGILLDSLWRDLNQQPRRLDLQVARDRESWRQNSYPAQLRCPKHDSALDWFMSMPDPRSKKPGAVLHGFECERRQELWVWQVDRGLDRPGPSVARKIRED